MIDEIRKKKLARAQLEAFRTHPPSAWDETDVGDLHRAFDGAEQAYSIDLSRFRITRDRMKPRVEGGQRQGRAGRFPANLRSSKELYCLDHSFVERQIEGAILYLDHLDAAADASQYEGAQSAGVSDSGRVHDSSETPSSGTRHQQKLASSEGLHISAAKVKEAMEQRDSKESGERPKDSGDGSLLDELDDSDPALNGLRKICLEAWRDSHGIVAQGYAGQLGTSEFADGLVNGFAKGVEMQISNGDESPMAKSKAIENMAAESIKLIETKISPGSDPLVANLLDELRRKINEIAARGQQRVLERELARIETEVLVEPTPSDCIEPGKRIFKRQGDVWDVSFGGASAFVRHKLGLSYIHILLSRPNRSISSLELQMVVNRTYEDGVSKNAGEVRCLRGNDAESSEILDHTALRSYKERLDSIKRDLEQAESNRDYGRHEALTKEKEDILEQLRLARGLAGRQRGFPSGEERARKSISEAIRNAIRTLREHHQKLALYLEARVDRGRSCCYRGDGVEWEV